MDAKAENTETASAAGANSKASEAPEKAKEGTAVRTIEERLEAGFKRMAGEDRETDTQPPQVKPENPPVPEELRGTEVTPPAEVPDQAADNSDETPPEKAAPEDGELKEGEVEGLSAKAQAKINARIHEINIKRKNAEAKAEQVEAQYKVLDGKIQDQNIQAVMKLGLDPEYITTEEAKTLNRFENLRAWKKWLRTHRAGYEGSGTKEDPSMTEAEVAEREAAIEDELLDIGGPARALWLERAKQMREDMALGRKIRLERASKPSPTKPADPKPPKLPEPANATRRPPVSAGHKVKAGFDNKEFNEAGADKNALEKQYEKIFGG